VTFADENTDEGDDGRDLMEGGQPEDRRAELASRRLAARRRTIVLRRVAAVGAALVATAGIWLLLYRDGSSEAAEDAKEASRGVSEPVAGLVRDMTLAERVDQVLLVGFDGTDASAPVVEDLRSRELGGLLITRRNWIDPEQGRALVSALRAAALDGGGISPLMVTAQEGGEYSSLAGLPPSSRELDIGRTGDPAAAEAWAKETAAALRSVGIDLNLAPVADVVTIASPLAGRAFTDDATLAADLTAAAVRGCEEAGIACAPSHFPGQGAASEDTDEGPATVSLDETSLATRDLAAFRAAFAEHAPAVVLSLAFFAAYDSVTPAALAPAVSTDLLRDELGYEGLAITDDLSAGAIKATQSPKDAAVAAVAAGADLIQISSPADSEGVADALLEAVESGEIDEDRLSEAAGRVLELKHELNLLRP
jgi:beta-N-acetylhexosaminidase